MPKSHITILGKTVRRIAQLRGGGSALPGLFVETIDPDFISRTLAQLPQGVIVISGTNGKTTTTKMVVELLESQGLKVFTNRTGSNFTRGVAAALLGEVTVKGALDADIAVLELDEAHAVHFVTKIPPRYSLLLNVMRDQLDRFGEIDATATMLETIASNCTSNVCIIIITGWANGRITINNNIHRSDSISYYSTYNNLIFPYTYNCNSFTNT